jgi:ABC-type multidrug transport system ATPase subunit
MEPPSVYTVRDLVKTYKAGKVRANDGEILPGEIFGLLGPNLA